MSLLDLPAEIIQQIVAPVDQPSISGLLRTSRYLRLAAEPAFYNSINSDSFGSQVQHPYNRRKPLPNAPGLLLRTLLLRPSLGSHVRHFAIKRTPVYIFGNWTPSNYTPKEREELERLAFVYNGPPGPDWADRLTIPNTWYSFIITFFTQLRSLTTVAKIEHIYQGGPYDYLPISRTPFVRPLVERSTLLHVDIVMDHFLDGNVVWNSPIIISLFRLPKVKSFRMGVWCASTYGPNRSIIIPGNKLAWPSDLLCPTLEKLSLVHSNIHEESLGCILASTPNLTHLEVDMIWYVYRTEKQAGGFIDCVALGNSIVENRCADTLTHVRLYVRFNDSNNRGPGHFERGERTGGPWEGASISYWDRTHHWGTKATLGSFKALRNLKVLETDPLLLFGWEPKFSRAIEDVLPDGLGVLVMGTWFEECRGWGWRRTQVREWLEGNMVRGTMGTLRCVRVKWDYATSEEEVTTEDEAFEGLCAWKGVSVKFGAAV